MSIDSYSFRQLISGFPEGHKRVPLNQCALRAEIAISGHFLCHRNSDLTRFKEKAYLSDLSVDFVYLSNVLKVFSIKCLSEEKEKETSGGRFMANKL